MNHFIICEGTQSVSDEQVFSVLSHTYPANLFSGKKILLVVPDGSRTAPIGQMFRCVHSHLSVSVSRIDVMFALGTHPPMSLEAMCARLEISVEERHSRYAHVGLLNHEWDNPDALQRLGTIPAREIRELSGGLFEMDVPVDINRRVFDYDVAMIIGPVFPHEVVGFSGGNKYFFPGIAGPEILNFFHWLGAVVTNPMIIGNKWTPVRKVVDRAAALMNLQKECLALVVDGKRFAGLFAGTPEAAWDEASELSRKLHITYKEKPFQTVLSVCPAMYDELWTGGKCMYKLEPVVADGGELIIYAPHISEISVTHGKVIEEIGYHCRDYFLKQWDRFKQYPWGTLAHSTHVRGIGSYEDGVEKCRVKVTLATSIPKETCDRINLGWMDYRSIQPDEFANREGEGIFLVPKAGEQLFHLKQRPAWAGG